MDPFNRQIYDDFYVAYFDAKGSMIYPTDPEEANIIKELIKNTDGQHLVYTPDNKMCYKLRIKRKIVDGAKVQVVELSCINEFMNLLSKASVDEITHLNNRKMAREMLIHYIEHATRNGENFGLILADLDGFKNVNDTYGHVNGDIVLAEVSRILFCSTRQESFREQDIVARIGGDEFLIVLKNVNEVICTTRAEQIRKNVENHQAQLFSESDILSYINIGTLSIGLYYVTNEELLNFYEKGYTPEEIKTALMDRCDTALYKSKNNGKNRVTNYALTKHLD